MGEHPWPKTRQTQACAAGSQRTRNGLAPATGQLRPRQPAPAWTRDSQPKSIRTAPWSLPSVPVAFTPSAERILRAWRGCPPRPAAQAGSGRPPRKSPPRQAQMTTAPERARQDDRPARSSGRRVHNGLRGCSVPPDQEEPGCRSQDGPPCAHIRTARGLSSGQLVAGAREGTARSTRRSASASRTRHAFQLAARLVSPSAAPTMPQRFPAAVSARSISSGADSRAIRGTG